MSGRMVLGLVIVAGIAVGALVGTRGEKPPAAKAETAQQVTAEDAERTRRGVLAVMVADLQGPDAPKGERLVAALGLIQGMARRGELRRGGTPEDDAMVQQVKKIQREGSQEAREAAERVLNSLR